MFTLVIVQHPLYVSITKSTSKVTEGTQLCLLSYSSGQRGPITKFHKIIRPLLHRLLHSTLQPDQEIPASSPTPTRLMAPGDLLIPSSSHFWTVKTSFAPYTSIRN